MKKILGDIIYTVVHALAKAIDFIADSIIPNDNLTRVLAPQSRQSFSENMRNNNGWY